MAAKEAARGADLLKNSPVKERLVKALLIYANVEAERYRSKIAAERIEGDDAAERQDLEQIERNYQHGVDAAQLAQVLGCLFNNFQGVMDQTMVAAQQRLSQTPSAISEQPIEEQRDKDTKTFPAVDWAMLVAQIKAGEDAGMEHLYKLFSRGIRYYLCRQLGPQELEDKVHDTFLIVVNAIKRGDLREPERLMGFVRTVVRRQVAAYIENAVHTRREQADLESGVTVADKTLNPEQEAISREKAALMKSALEALSKRDRDILVRFYLKEQSQEQICRDMDLTETQFRLLKSRAKAKFGEIGKKKLASSGIFSVFVRAQAG